MTFEVLSGVVVAFVLVVLGEEAWVAHQRRRDHARREEAAVAEWRARQAEAFALRRAELDAIARGDDRWR